MNKTSGIKLTVVIVVIAAALIFSIKPLAENINPWTRFAGWGRGGFTSCTR